MKQLYFLTSNERKIAHAKKYLKNIELLIPDQIPVFIEIQADHAEDILLNKLSQAAYQLKKPLIVEDFSVEFLEYNGFPGPYAKFALKTLGAYHLQRLAGGTRVKTVSLIGYFDGKSTCKVFRGELEGYMATAEQLPVAPDSKQNTTSLIFLDNGVQLDVIMEQDPEFLNHRGKALMELARYLEQENG
jgi:inosine/xanthosine triphosphate pyrophosphatase family protein